MFINPEANRDYEAVTHTWPRVKLNLNDSIAVEARTHTNGRVPERSGTAWARGRWRGILIAPTHEMESSRNITAATR